MDIKREVIPLLQNYEWGQLWMLVRDLESCEADRSREFILALKAMLLAGWWQDALAAREILEHFPSRIDDPLTLFAVSYGWLALGESGKCNLYRNMMAKRCPKWMNLWIECEFYGRSLQLKKQIHLIKRESRSGVANFLKMALLQSLNHDRVDTKRLGDALHDLKITHSGDPLDTALLLRSGIIHMADVDPSHVVDQGSPVLLHQLAKWHLDNRKMDESVLVYDRLATSGMMNLASLQQWLALAVSLPQFMNGSETRIERALEIAPNNLAFQSAVASFWLVQSWISGNYKKAYELVQQYPMAPMHTNLSRKHTPNAQKFFGYTATFFNYVLQLCAVWQKNRTIYAPSEDDNPRILYVFGESHCLPLANLFFRLHQVPTKGVARFVMGAKMYHLAHPEANYHAQCLIEHLDALSDGAHLLMTIGEIDTRPNEGIWRTFCKKGGNLDEIISDTVDGYVDCLSRYAADKRHGSITIQGIPAPGYKLTDDKDPGDKTGFIAMIAKVNERLKTKTLEQGWPFLDVYTATVNDQGTSNGNWHIDGTHISPLFYEQADKWLVQPAGLAQCVIEHERGALSNWETKFQSALQLHRAGKLVEARAAYERCLALTPNHPLALTNLGSLCRQQGEMAPALEYLRRAVVVSPQDPNALFNLGNALRETGEIMAAVETYRKALSVEPKASGCWYNLALALADMGDTEASRHAYTQSIATAPERLDARLNLAASYASTGELTQARSILVEVLRIKPDYAPALNNLATLLQDTSDTGALLAALQKTVQLAPELPQPRSNLLMGMQYHLDLADGELLGKAKEWGKWAMQRALTLRGNKVYPAFQSQELNGRALRVGYVSADLCAHPVGLFVQQVIASHNPAVVKPVVYSNGNALDDITRSIQQTVRQATGAWAWRDVRALDDLTLAEQIRDDAIDILVDLSGHTAKSRLSMFALRPVSVQISWLGYFATTGLPTMDFVILDPYHAPPGAETQFSERIIRLPHNRFCYQPAPFAPDVTAPPFLKNGYITFGSFNNTAKLNAMVLDTWASILLAVPDSRLILKWRTFADKSYCERMRTFFSGRGISAERLELRPMSVHRQLLEEYADIDIALDPFPFSGGHTSCETLWMGVPIVTLPQERVVSRQTWSFLNNIGLPGLAAKDIDGYVQLAVGLANSRDTLKELRDTLRERMSSSPLCDVAGFTRLLEDAYLKAWDIINADFPSSVAQESVRPEESGKPDFVAEVREKNTQLRALLEKNPDQPDVWIELAEQMASLLQHEAAVACANEALQRRPDDAAALTLKGNALRSSGKIDEALACYRRVLELLPGSAVGHCNFGVALQNIGRYDEAIDAFEVAISRYPGVPAFWGNLAVSLTYSPGHTPADVLLALRRFDAQVARPLREPRSHANDRNPARRLRVGYVSPDFRKHAVAYFALPLIEGHNKDQVEVFCYYNHRQNDGWTAAFRKAADHWLDCAGMNDAELAERIRSDGIDILVDLAGHTENNRLLTFARKPAPVQVTWMGYVTTTGMSAMDWRVTHSDADPEGAEAHYSEKLWRLPGTMWCYRPLPGMPEVSPPPVARNGYVTFGSFNRYSKNSPLVLETWAQILNRVPDSRLVICVPEGEIRQRMASFFNERGIAPERIAAFAKLSHEDFWKLHGEVDIALDPFPFGGGTTTCETLWMGVPVVTCTGKEGGDFAPRFASRMGYAFLNNIGVPELACETITGYIDTAVRLALDPPRLTALRQSLRDKMTSAPLTDEARFAREMEQAYRAMWQTYSSANNDGNKHPKKHKSSKSIARQQGGAPTTHEVNTLAKQFANRKYTEAARLAKILTERFPQNGIGWKALGAALQKLGKSAEALVSIQQATVLLPNDAEAHFNLACILKKLGRLEEAETGFSRALEINPNYVDAYSNLGSTLLEQGKLLEAEARIRRVLKINPGCVAAYNNLGITLHNLGRLEDAEASYLQAISIQPDYAEAYNNLGCTLQKQGKGAEAEASCRQALELKPDFAEAHGNLGNALADLGRRVEAEASYRRALALRPDYIDAFNNLAILLNAQGDLLEALGAITQSLKIRETGAAKEIFVNCVKRYSFRHDSSELRAMMVRAMTEPWGRPSDLARAVIELVKLNPEITLAITQVEDAWPVRLSAVDFFRSITPATFAADTLLCTLLDSIPISDMEMERLLTTARHAMLEAAIEMSVADNGLGWGLSFHCALARQCFINEYVFSYTDDEIKKARDLRDLLIEALEAKGEVPVLWLVAVAAYFPLHSISHAHRVLERQWPQDVMAVLAQQITEPEEEQKDRGSIPKLTDIDHEVSLKVQNQYEENPYPRWITLPPTYKPMEINIALRNFFPFAPLRPLGIGDTLEVLIAGCGTGQHSIQTAQRFEGAKVLAIDLSVSSLCYARRKTLELGLTSIDYAQADLLKVGEIGRSFDVIESVGVLHHLSDPWVGWRELLSLLRPGGFMKLGFYSEVARRNIVRIRDVIAKQGYGSTAEDIRRCRQELVDLDKSADFGNTLKSGDFFSVSACRDLLFHVQEHRMTLAGIDAFLRENNLVFLGFEIEPHVLYAYKLRFPDDRAATNLGQWQIFENENPDTFFGMYQFWIQKAG